MTNNNQNGKSVEQWLWDAACSIRGAKDAPKYKDYILPLVFTKRLCDVFDDEVNRIAKEVGGRAKAFKLVERDKKLVRFYIPLKSDNPEEPVWSVIRKLADKIGEELTTHLRSIADENPKLKGIIDRVDFNATTHGQRDISDDRLSALIEKISLKRLGLQDVERDIIGKSYEYLIRKFAEGGGQSAGEFYTPSEVGMIMALILDPEPGMEAYDPCCGSAGLLIACEQVATQKTKKVGKGFLTPLKLYGQEFIPETWAMANMNMVIHDMEGEIEIGDSFLSPKFRKRNGLRKFDIVVANPMWNQTKTSLPYVGDDFFSNDELNRFFLHPPTNTLDWGWVQHIYASLSETGRAAIVLDPGAVTRGSGNINKDKEKAIRRWFVDRDIVESVIYLPENLFYNTPSPGIIIILNRKKKHKGEVLLINASLEFEKGEPKNFIAETGIKRISDIYAQWKEEKNFSKIITTEEIINKDFNLSPNRYIQTNFSVGYRTFPEISEELKVIESEARQIDSSLDVIIERLIEP